MNKKTRLIMLCALLISGASFAQFKKFKEKITPVLSGSNTPALTEEEVGRGLKEALTKGIEKGVATVSKPDGFFKDPVIKILMPPDAKKVEEKLRKVGQGKKVDEAIESMNRAAEDASKSAKDIFVDAIKEMTIEDAMSILKGEENAATNYLEKTTRQKLYELFEPVIATSLDKVGATKHWETVMTAYNKIPFVEKVNPNLKEYVTNKAIDGLFVQIAKEEKEIRKNPLARTSDLLKKVFGQE